MTLLERDGVLAQLDARWIKAREGPGQLVFVEGEAGIGKTTVLRAFAASMPADTPVYWGACEAMTTPRPLGALDDIAIDSGGKLAIANDGGSGERHRLFVAFVGAKIGERGEECTLKPKQHLDHQQVACAERSVEPFGLGGPSCQGAGRPAELLQQGRVTKFLLRSTGYWAA